MFSFKQANKTIELTDDFLNTIDEGGLVFKEGVKNYLAGFREHFLENLKQLSTLENKADSSRRQVENILYTKSLMPQLRGDVMRLLEVMDNIIDLAKMSLFQFDVEVPHIPEALHTDLIKLTELSVASIESLIPAARDYFRAPEQVKDKIHRVFFYEKEADKLADAIKRKVFQNMPELSLSQKFHLRYFTLHIESLSDAAQQAAEMLSIMAIKRTI